MPQPKRYRSAVMGRFIKKSQADRNPRQSVAETVKPAPKKGGAKK